MLEVHSEHQLEEKSQWIMKGFTTFYLGDFNDSVNGKLLLFVLSAFIFLVFILICLLMPRHLLRTNTILSRQKSILCRCMLALGILDMLCVFTEIYGICIGVFMQDFYWWCMFCLFLGATITSVFTIIYDKSRAENTFDYLVPKSVKKYLYNRHVTDAEYKIIVVFLVYPLFVLGSSPLGIGVLIYILPVSLITLLLMEIRNFSNWSHGDIHKDGNELKGDGLCIFKDYYLLLDIDRSASEEDIDKAFNKAMTKYNSGIDYSLYGEIYKHNIQEAYRVLSSINRLKPEYDREFDAYRTSNMPEYQYSDEKMYDMKEVDKNKNEFKNNVEKDLKTEGELIKLASLLVPLDMSLRVSYVGSISKEQANVDIPSSYLKEVVLDNRLSNYFK